MRSIRLVLLGFAVTVSSFYIPAGPAVAAPPPAAPAHPVISYYVSLGDSLAQGVQADPTTGKSVLTNQGYPDQLYPILKKTHPGLRLIKLGCPGETTTSMISAPNPRCPAGSLPQLAAAQQFLLSHKGHIAYLTINIGSNDALACTSSTAIDLACLTSAITTVSTNLGTILRTLRSTLSRGTAAAGMTYYDPLLAVFPVNPGLAVQSVVGTDALNAAETAQYVRYGFKVARVDEAFQTNDFAPLPNSWTPTNYARICGLTWMCTFGNVHPNAAGYAVIARSFAGAVRTGHRR